MNTLFYQNILTKQFLEALADESVDICVSYQGTEKSSLQSTLAVKELFEMGFDINTWVSIEDIHKSIKPLINHAIFHCDNIIIIKECMTHLEPSYISKMTYHERSMLVENILEKNLASGQKKELLELLFDKGYRLEPRDIYSSELRWIADAHHDFFDILLVKQPEFNFNHFYLHPYQEGGTTLLEACDLAIESNQRYHSKNQQKKESTLLSLKEKLTYLSQYQNLENQLEEKPKNAKKQKI